MAISSSPASAGSQGPSTAPHPLPSLPSIHDAPVLSPHSHNAAQPPLPSTLSRVGQRNIQPPRRSPAIVCSSPMQPSHPRASSSQSQREASPSVAKTTRHYRWWTCKDDALLIAGIKKHGKHWAAVKRHIDQGGGTPRSADTLPNRYRLLLKSQKQGVRSQGGIEDLSQASSTQAAVASSLPDQHHEPTASSSAGPSAPTGHRCRDYQFWSPSELQTVSSIPASSSPRNVYAIFCAAFPSTTRSKRCVVEKWRCCRSQAQTDTQAIGGGAGDVDGDEPMEHEQGTGVFASAHGSAVARSSPTLPALKQSNQGDGRSSGSLPPTTGFKTKINSSAPRATSVGLFSPYDTSSSWAASDSFNMPEAAAASPHRATPTAPSTAPMQAQSSDPYVSAAQHLPQKRRINYSFTVTPNGFLFSDLPPGYQVRILTPTQCQIIGSEEGSNESMRNGNEQHQGPSLSAAPFAFELKHDGSVGALNLPDGAEVTRDVVGPDLHHLSIDRQARMRTTFSAVDGYTVCFEGHVALEV